MTEPLIRHEDVAGYLLGSLTAAGAGGLRAPPRRLRMVPQADGELSAPAELFRHAAPDYDMPAALEAPDACRRRARRPENGARPARVARRLLALGARACCRRGRRGRHRVFLVAPTARPHGCAAGRSSSRPCSYRPPAARERATVVVEKTGIGREISFRSDDLPILPQGEYYELWFVGSGDTRRRPNRISAGTFHPDEQGRSVVELTAAVDPLLYPILSVTAEPADGNPERTGPEVLRSRSD